MFAASKSGKASGSTPTPTTDASFGYVPLLLETGSSSSLNTTVTDSSASPNTVTRVSNPSTGWVSPYQTDGYWGNFFNGSTDYLSRSFTSTTDGMYPQGTTYTFEAWVYLLSNSTDNVIYEVTESNVSSFASWELSVNNSTKVLSFYVRPSTGAATVSITGNVLSLNTWYHVAVSVSSGSGKLFINGTQAGSTTTIPALTFTPVGAAIGIYPNGYTPATSPRVNGYISNLRLVQGVAVYTTTPFTPSTNPLTTIQSANVNGNPSAAITGTATSLLTCQSNRFKDNSNNNYTLTLAGTPQVTPYFYPSGFTAPAASPGAALLNGTNQYLSTPQTAGGPLDLTSGDFTVEAWVYPTSFNSVQCTIVGTRGAVGGNWEFRFSTSGILQFYYTAGSLVGSGTAAPLNAWSHVAAVRSSNTVTLYLNGVSVGSLGSFGTGVGRDGPLLIGIETTTVTNDAFPGYIGNLRIVKGTPVYTGTPFTPPSGLLTRTGGTYPSTTNVNTSIPSANTSLLLALSDSNYNSATNGVQNNTFIDTSNYAFPITRNGTPTQGSSTPYWPDGQWSNNFNGSSNLSVASDAALAMGSGNFTVEFWVYLRSTTNNRTLSWPSVGNLAINCASAGYWNYSSYGVGDILTSSIITPLNTWTHVAISRTGTTTRIFINGAQGAITTVDTNNWGQSVLNIGSDIASNFLNGYLSNLRIVKGVGVYTGAFTPPTSPLQKTQAGNGGTIQAITGSQTSLLTCQSNRFVNNSNISLTLTVANGTPTVQAFQPFSPTASYTTALYGGSGYFNGSTDYLSITDGSALQLGSGNFTIEGWVYCSAVSGNNSIYSRNLFGMIIGISSSNFTFFASSNGSSWNLASGITFGAATSNTWAHFAAVRNGANITLYLNGVLGNTVAVSTSALYEVTAPTVGYWTSGGANWYLNGYISNLRVVKGTAVYTGAFTPPTLAPLATTGPASAASYSSTTNVNTTFLTPASLLLNMTNAGIYDAAAQNDVTTAGSAVTAVTPAKWSPSSMSFNGSNSYAQVLSNPAFTLGTSNFTIEFWVYFNSVAAAQTVVGRHITTAAGDWAIYTASTGSLNYYLSSNGSTWNLANQVSIGSISTGTWYYVALVRNGSVFTPYIGTTPGSAPTAGTTTTTASALYANTQALTVGAANNSLTFLNGYVQDFRFTVGVARSITTVPSAALPTK